MILGLRVLLIIGAAIDGLLDDLPAEVMVGQLAFDEGGRR